MPTFPAVAYPVDRKQRLLAAKKADTAGGTVSDDLGSSAGYAHARYAQAFSLVGSPRQLAGCKGWVIERTIPNCHARDAMGCYPLFCCRHWTKLAEDLTALRGQYVSIVLVTDPFGPLGQSQLREIFDHVLAFKEHFVARLADPLESIVSRKRYQAARKALERLTIEVIDPPSRALGDWMPLYSGSVRRHKIQRLKVLSQGALAQMLDVPGAVVLRASMDEETVGMHIEYVQDEYVYGHLAAYSPLGRRLNAAAALHLWEIEYFRHTASFIDWGGVPYAEPRHDNGLGVFKRGFSNDRRMVYLCGKILDPERYRKLCEENAAGSSPYFPGYRHGEFR